METYIYGYSFVAVVLFLFICLLVLVCVYVHVRLALFVLTLSGHIIIFMYAALWFTFLQGQRKQFAVCMVRLCVEFIANCEYHHGCANSLLS